MGEGERMEGPIFADHTEGTLRRALMNVSVRISDIRTSEDVRPGRPGGRAQRDRGPAGPDGRASRVGERVSRHADG